MQKDNLINLVDEYRKGNTAVFDRLYTSTVNDMYRYARKLTSDESIIEDAIQDSYIKIADSIESLRDSSSFLSWGFTILRNNINSAYRRNRNFAAMPVAVDANGNELEFVETLETNDIETLPGSEMDRRETEKIIREALYSLPELQRQTLTYFYFDEMSVKDIALFMDCSVGTVKSRLNGGREKLRLAIAAHEETNGYRLHGLLPLPLISSALKAADLSIVLPLSKSSALLGSIKSSAEALSLTSATAANATKIGFSTFSKGASKASPKAGVANILGYTAVAVVVTGLACGGVLYALGTGGIDSANDTGSRNTERSLSSDISNKQKTKAQQAKKNDDVLQKQPQSTDGLLFGKLNSEPHSPANSVAGSLEKEAVNPKALSNEAQDIPGSDKTEPDNPSIPDTPKPDKTEPDNVPPDIPEPEEPKPDSESFKSPMSASNIINGIQGKFTSDGKTSFISIPPSNSSIYKLSSSGLEPVWSNPEYTVDSLFIHENKLYFAANTGQGGFIASIDAASGELQILYEDLYSKFSDLVISNNTVYFRANADEFHSDELALALNSSSPQSARLISDSVRSFNSLICTDGVMLYGIIGDELKSLDMVTGVTTSMTRVNKDSRVIASPKSIYFTVKSGDSSQILLIKYKPLSNSFVEILSLPIGKPNILIESDDEKIIYLTESSDGNIQLLSQEALEDADKKIIFEGLIPISVLDSQNYKRSCSLLGSDRKKIYVLTNLENAAGESLSYVHSISKETKEVKQVSISN